MKIKLMLFIALFLLISCSEGKSLPLKEQYAHSWSSESILKIEQTLVSNNISGCGEYKYKKRIGTNSSYIVRCSRDGKNWQSYIISTASDDVDGPYTPASELN